MGDSFAAFTPTFPATWRLPTGYTVDGIADEEGVFFYWSRWVNNSPVEFGDNEPNKRKCRTEAWAHYRSGLARIGTKLTRSAEVQQNAPADNVKKTTQQQTDSEADSK